MYDYFVLTIGNQPDITLQETLHKITAKDLGWELVTVNKEGQYIFKRPKK